MDGISISEVLSDKVKRLKGDCGGTPPLSTFGEIFDEVWPYYFALGMTEYEFWDGDCYLAKVYREAEKLNVEKQNTMAWLQGLYIYDALCKVAPIFNPFAGGENVELESYPEKPYSFSGSVKDQEEEVKRDYDAKKSRFLAMVNNINANFENKDEKPR